MFLVAMVLVLAVFVMVFCCFRFYLSETGSRNMYTHTHNLILASNKLLTAV